MRFLSVAERELRAAARQKATYRVRWITATAFFGLLVWLMWALDGFTTRNAAPAIFQAFSVATFFYCVIVGAMWTADCLSREKRDGTLGLLFLTNLNSAEIVAGKLCSHALSAMYGLFAVFPLLAMPLLMGGVTFDHFWRVVLALVNALFFSVAAGFVASAISVRQFPAISLAILLSLLWSLGSLGAAEATRFFRYPTSWTDWTDGFALFSPAYAMSAAENTNRMYGRNQYWLSVAAVAATSCLWLVLSAWWIARTWRDRPKAARAVARGGFRQRWRIHGSAGRVALRRRLLKINPFFWLASRQRVSAPVFMLLTVALVLITVLVTAPYFGSVIPAGAMKPIVGHIFAWLWTGLAIHALVLYYASAAAAQRPAEDKQAGALELILSTPATERSISRGLWLAYARRMFFPALIATLVHFFFIWQGAVAFVMEAPVQLPAGTTPWQLLWSAFSGRAIGGVVLDWHFGFILQILVLVFVVLIANWLTLGWVGRWLGLSMKHPGFAPITALALVLIPPWLLFSLICYTFDEMGVDRMPERQFLPMMMWIGFGVGVAHCFLLSAWAAGRLRRDFRTAVTSRFQPRMRRRWWPTRRTVVRFAIGIVLLALAVPAFYAYHNWRNHRAWAAFQRELQQRGESLDLAALLPGPVPDNQNFARTPVFQSLLNPNRTNTSAGLNLFDALVQGRFSSSTPPYYAPNDPTSTAWIKQGFTDLDKLLTWIRRSAGPVISTDRPAAAASLLDGLQPLADTMRAVAEAANLPFFQSSTNRDGAAVLQRNHLALVVIERLHALFQWRASARLALDRTGEAGDDVLTSLRLARLARQSPDLKASTRVQAMITLSLQPIWEGLVDRRWSELQLAAFQNELAGFNLLSDHTNAVRRVVLAHIAIWRSIAESRSAGYSVPASRGGYLFRSEWKVQPRGWWFANCIQLYDIARQAIERVNVVAGRVRVEHNWPDLNGLPLESETTQLLQQADWWGAAPALVSFAQTAVNQGIIACALERHRLAHGAYPETLDQLVPAYLRDVPRDTVRGRPMIYQRTDEGRYILRSVGPNETDDRSKAASDDWLWMYPAPTNAPPASATGGATR